jgi:hypothetical protein
MASFNRAMGEPRRTATDAIFQRLGKALRTENDRLTREPLPQRLVDLIKCLEEKERSRVEGRGCQTERRGRLSSRNG